FRRGMVASLLSRFTRILAQDGDSARRLHKIIGAGAQVEVAGRIEESSDPLTCNEVERAELAEILRARPVWLAAACPEAEEAAVLAAHAHALRLAHRMLLILSPADAQRAGVLAARCQAEG
ncbi:MAG: 3-deoxy-D-manno-octulosonic acid transferase, partial [Rhodobacteraceae bacterium]|nr:3-deoxy-D-manno-octulosonic acid transferase [Paracoccaceae bacterium]